MNALHPGLNALVDRGLLTCGQADEVTAFAGAIRDAVGRGEMTPVQGDVLGQLLGVRHAANTNARRTRRSHR